MDRVVGVGRSAEALLDRLGRTSHRGTTSLHDGLLLDASNVADELTAPLLPPDARMSSSTASAPVSRRATSAKPPAQPFATPTPADGGWTSGPNAIIYTRSAQDAKLYSLARRWLIVDASGNASFLEATKAEMQRELGVPFRDLMILDPNLPTAYPGSVFIRPRAIVVNLEHIKMIVVSTYALLLGTDAPEPHARQFVAMLQRQLAPRAACQPSAVNAGPPPPPTASTSAARARPPSPIPAPLSRVASSLDLEADAAAAAAMEDAIDGVHESTTDLLGLRHTPSDLRVLALPFELRVLEATLHDVCKRLLDETMALELDAAPALEKLADQVNSAALERVRRVKGRMNSLTQRVAAVRDELGKLLADDSDMRAMCLTMREQEAAAAEERHHSWGAGGANHRGAPRAARRSRGGEEDKSSRAAAPPATDAAASGDAAPHATRVELEDGTETMTTSVVPLPTIATSSPSPSSPPAGLPAAGEILASFPSPSATHFTAPPPTSPSARHRRARRRRRARRSRRSDDDVSSDDAPLSSSSSSSSSSSRASRASEDEHEGVEALLEAYYMHVDFSHKRLTELRDAIEDTEDLAEINLDSQRNQLIKIDLVLSNGMLSVGIFSMVAGTFGMNLRTGWESQPGAFREVCIVSAAFCFAVFASVVVFLRRRKLL